MEEPISEQISLICQSFGAEELDIEQIEKLVHYLDLLSRWTKKIDLVADADLKTLFDRHIVDCLAACFKLDELVLSKLKQDEGVLDVGSGAGLPGIVLAILYSDRPVYLVEPREKRVIFLKEAKRELKLENLIIHQKRLELVSPEEVPGASVSICRALGLDEIFVKESHRMLCPPSQAVIMAGPNWASETLKPKKITPYTLPNGQSRQLLAF